MLQSSDSGMAHADFETLESLDSARSTCRLKNLSSNMLCGLLHIRTKTKSVQLAITIKQ